MHREILSAAQLELCPLLSKFKKDFGLVGGTAIALHLGHRQSLDFDLFTPKLFDNFAVRNIIVRAKRRIGATVHDERGQFTVLVDHIQITFLRYPFPIKYSKQSQFFKMPDLLTLAAMKAYALGRRAKWKDYVDLYFIATKYRGIVKIVTMAKKIFGGEFNEKAFRQQLVYFKDVNYSEKVSFLPGFARPDRVIQKELVKFSLA